MPSVLLEAGILLAVTVVLLAVGRAGYLVYRDAADRDVAGPSPVLWGLGSVFVPFLVIPAYAYLADRPGGEPAVLSTYDDAAVRVAVAVPAAFAVGGMLSPPDPVSQLRYAAVLLLPCLVLVHLGWARLDAFGGSDRHPRNG